MLELIDLSVIRKSNLRKKYSILTFFMLIECVSLHSLQVFLLLCPPHQYQ